MVKSRCGDGLIDRHFKHRVIEKTLQRGRDDSRTTGCAAGVGCFAVFDDDCRCHAAERSLARSDHVGFALNQPKRIGLAGIRGEVVHLIVEQNAEFRHDHKTAECQVDRFRAGDRIAFRVH